MQVIGAIPTRGMISQGFARSGSCSRRGFFARKYDELIEIHNDEAYAMCLRLNREEGIIAGPGAALGLLNARSC